VIASASAVLESSDQVMIVGVAVDPDFRRHGVGKVLMHYLMDLYTQHKNKRVCLYYDDPRAEKLYWQYGFKSHGRWGMLVKMDD
jgi:predicted GNAT family acetyltransferase